MKRANAGPFPGAIGIYACRKFLPTSF
jgi:hypothetical protein